MLKAACLCLHNPAARCFRLLPLPIPSQHPGPFISRQLSPPQFQQLNKLSSWDTVWLYQNNSEYAKDRKTQRMLLRLTGFLYAFAWLYYWKTSRGQDRLGLLRDFFSMGDDTTQTLNQKRDEILTAINLWNKRKSWETFITFCSFGGDKII